MSDEKTPTVAVEPSAAPAPTPQAKKQEAKPSKPSAPVAKKEEAPAPVAKKEEAPAPVAKKEEAPAPVAANLFASPEAKAVAASVKGIGGVIPRFDDSGLLMVSVQFFTDPHVTSGSANYNVRRFVDGRSEPYVVIPADSQEVAFRTGLVITGDFDDFIATPPVMGEGLVTSVETRGGELYMIIRPFGNSVATIIQGKTMAAIKVTA